MKDEAVDCHVINEALRCLEQQACLSTGNRSKCQCDYGYGHGTNNNCLRCPAGTATDTSTYTCQPCPSNQLTMYRAVCVTKDNCTLQNGIVNEKAATCDCPNGTYYDPTIGCVGQHPDTSVNCSAIQTRAQCISQETCHYANNACSCSPYYPVTTSGGCSKCPYGQVFSNKNQTCHSENVTDGQTVSPGQTLIFDYTQCETIDGQIVNKTQCICKPGLQYFAYKEACIIPLNERKDSGDAAGTFIGALVAILSLVLVCGAIIIARKAKRSGIIQTRNESEQLF